jgi:osmoprotectant transport system ATP-binding protein
VEEVELAGVSKNYGAHRALDDVSVTFRKGNITAIVGRSGSGKSTLLKTINGLVKPTAGRVTVSGKSSGYVVQGNGLFPHLTIRQNISLPGKIAGKKEDPARVDELLTFTDLPLSYLDKYPSELSGGEQQRVALCRALYLNPPLLLLDEPFGSLDTYTRRDLQEKLLDIRKVFNLTVVLVTHDIAEAIRLSDDILVLDHGRVQQFGPAKDISF